MPRTHLPAVALAAILAGCTEATTAPAPAPTTETALFSRTAEAVRLVTGGGKLDISSFDPSLPPETYAFTAARYPDGTVRGQMQVRFSDPQAVIHAEVTCLAVSGSDAWLGIVVTRSDAPELLPVGAERWVNLRDSGEGASAEPDRMGFFRAGGGAARCDERRAVPLPFAWLHGNVTVH